jgi:hypothetical protein
MRELPSCNRRGCVCAELRMPPAKVAGVLIDALAG